MINRMIAAGILAILAGCGVSQREFFDAAVTGDSATVQRYIDDGGDVNSIDYDSSALMLAAQCGRTRVVEQLLKAGADPNLQDFCGNNALFHSLIYQYHDNWAYIRAGYFQPEFKANRIWKMLLDAGADPAPPGANGLSALFLAAVPGDPEQVAALLAAGAYDGHNIFDDDTALSATGNGQVAIMLLMKKTPDIPTLDILLIAAVCGGDAEAVNMLLEFGANPDAADGDDCDGMTALMHAARRSRPDIVKLLLDAGADPNSTVRNGKTALGHAIEGAKIAGLKDTTLNDEVIALLLDAGTVQQLYSDSYREHSELILALYYDRADAAEILINHGPDPEALGPALMSAAGSTSESMPILLLNAGADPNYQDEDGETPLFVAASLAHPTNVRILLDAGADPTLRDKKGRTALDVAGQYVEDDPSNPEVVSLLQNADPRPPRKGASPAYLATMQRWIDSGGEIDAPWYHDPFLVLAVKRDDLDFAKMLLKSGANPDGEYHYDGTPLTMAVRRGNFAMVELLLSAGADPDADKSSSESTLLSAVNSGSVEMTLRLLRAGANPFRQNGERISILEMTRSEPLALIILFDAMPQLPEPDAELLAAVIGGNIAKAESLLAVGADPDAATANGITALMQASGRADLAMMRLLLKAEADPHRRDESGRTALHHCVHGWATDENKLEWRLAAPDAIKLLLAAGADPNAESRCKRTPLHIAVGTAYDNTDVIRLLLRAGADPNRADSNEETPLYLLVEYYLRPMDRVCFENARLLIDAGANVNTENYSGQTPLKSAVDRNMPEVVELLLANGANPKLKNKYGETALDCAIEQMRRQFGI